MVIIKHREKFKKNLFEMSAWDAQNVVAGLDEVGRGCLAGPLVTAAVIIPPYKTSRLIADSKLLDENARNRAYQWITRNCWYNVGIVHNRAVDHHNVWYATLLAMKKALVHLLALCPLRPCAIVVDAMPLDLFDTTYKEIPVHYFYFGEQKSISIAAASIVAKVTRDRLMRQFDRVFPGYSLAQHKGYSTKIHKEAVVQLGHSIIHRMSYLQNINTMSDDYDEQQTLC